MPCIGERRVEDQLNGCKAKLHIHVSRWKIFLRGEQDLQFGNFASQMFNFLCVCCWSKCATKLKSITWDIIVIMAVKYTRSVYFHSMIKWVSDCLSYKGKIRNFLEKSHSRDDKHVEGTSALITNDSIDSGVGTLKDWTKFQLQGSYHKYYACNIT